MKIMVKFQANLASLTLIGCALTLASGCNGSPSANAAQPGNPQAQQGPANASPNQPKSNNSSSSALLATMPAGSVVKFSAPLDLPFERNGKNDSVVNAIKMDSTYISGHAVLYARGIAYTAGDLQDMTAQNRAGLLDNNCVIDAYNAWVEDQNGKFVDRSIQDSFSIEKPLVETSSQQVCDHNCDPTKDKINVSETVDMMVRGGMTINHIVCTKSVGPVDNDQTGLAGITISDLQLHLGGYVQVTSAE